MRYAKLFLLGFFLLGLSAYCEEAVKPVGETSLPAWLNFVLSFEFVWKGLITGGGLLLSWIFGMWIRKQGSNTATAEAIEALKAGVQLTYEEFVQEAKKASADGKLTLQEKKAAREMAISKAMEIAKGPALALLQTWGKPFLEGLIGQIVQKIKAKKAAVPPAK